jgi:hypothetical protein
MISFTCHEELGKYVSHHICCCQGPPRIAQHLKGSHGSRSPSLYHTHSPHACSNVSLPIYGSTGRVQHFILRRNKAAVYLQQLAHIISLSFSMLLRNKIRLQYVAHHRHNGCEGILTTLRDGTGLVRPGQVKSSQDRYLLQWQGQVLSSMHQYVTYPKMRICDLATCQQTEK